MNLLQTTVFRTDDNVCRSDAGIYKCVSTNTNRDETTWMGRLRVEDARSNAIFHRVERQDLPPAPSQPVATAVNSHSIDLTWTMESTDILDYLIEYYEVNSSNRHFQWERFSTKTQNTRQMIANLKADSTYQFSIRARNSFGYGLPSVLSELIETKNNLQSTDDIIYLHDPVDIQETSVTIKWDILQNDQSINQLAIYIQNKKESNERIETVSHSKTPYTIKNLRPNTEYSIRLVPLRDRLSSSSNTIFVRTSESLPSSSPTNILVQLISTTSLSIQWTPPMDNETNGRIIAYKVNCLSANESNSIRLTNISAETKGLFIKNLMENMEYCISIAARTRMGYGPYSPPICVITGKWKGLQSTGIF